MSRSQIARNAALSLWRYQASHRVRLARGGLSLLPLCALIANAWMNAPLRSPGAHAAPARRWLQLDAAHRAGGDWAPFRLEAVLPATFELSSLNGSNGFTNNGIAGGNSTGWSVSDGGDVNGDGFPDILMGAHNAAPHGSQSGQSYVVYGGTAVPGTVELSALNGANGFMVNGIATGHIAGWWVSGAGDVNGDGFDDILIGAPQVRPHGIGSGQSYVVYGKSAMPATVELASLNGTNGFYVNGISTLDGAGHAVSDAGDVNGDGFGDILIGSRYADPHGSSSGQSYVVYGGSAVPTSVELSSMNGTNGFFVNGVSAGDLSGHALSSAGDVNGDGFADILIGAYGADPHGAYSGQSYVVYGGSGLPASVELSGMNGTNGFFVNGISTSNVSGRALSGAGDVNADGFADIVIVSPLAGPNGTSSGQSYVVYGGSALPASTELSGLNGSNGFRVNGISTNDRGEAASSAGDVNGDGFGDILLGAHLAAPHGYNSGESYVVYGAAAVPGTIELSGLNGSDGFRVEAISSRDDVGRSVSGAGDVNNDGFDDLLIGAPGADPHGSYSGQSYVIYGDAGDPPTATPTRTNTPTTTASRTSTATATPTSTSTASATPTRTSTATATSTPTSTPTRTPTPTTTPTPSPTTTPTPSPTPTVTAGPTVTPTPTQPRGDCNADNAVNAADVSGLVLEIFDGDGTSPAAVPGGTYPGDPNGCNANADAVVDAGDLACVARIIFGSGGGCGP